MVSASAVGSVGAGFSVKETTEYTESARRGTELEDETPEAVFQQWGVEVHQQAYANLAHSQIRSKAVRRAPAQAPRLP
jgi:hypothetical protein